MYFFAYSSIHPPMSSTCSHVEFPYIEIVDITLETLPSRSKLCILSPIEKTSPSDFLLTELICPLIFRL